MHTVLPIAIIVLLGALSGLVMARLRWNFVIRAGAAALLATVVWVSGCVALLWAVGEMGPLLLKPIVQTYFTALAPALLVGWLIRLHKSNTSREQAIQD